MLKSFLMLSMYSFMMTPLMINIIMILMMNIPQKNEKIHPLTLMIILIIKIFLISIMMNLIYYSLICFIMFLAMIGGLMIIYMYITSLTNNEFFSMKYKNMMKYIFIKIYPWITLLLIFYFNSNPMNFSYEMEIQDSWKINLYHYIYDQLNINIIYNKINNKSSIFIMLYIYYTMICIMNICYKLKSPLRQLTF